MAAAYYNSANNTFHKTLPSDFPQSTAVPSPASNLQIFSPQNITYQTAIVQLNVTANNSTTKITYMLDGEKNITLAKDADICLDDGVHKITFYAFNKEGKLEDSKSVTFSVEHLTPTPKPPPTRTEAINYFVSQGFTIQKVGNVTIDGYNDKGVPIVRYSMSVGLPNVVFYAHAYNTTVIYEFDYDMHWTIFYVEQPESHFKFEVYSFD
jgi:hypothetical protein